MSVQWIFVGFGNNPSAQPKFGVKMHQTKPNSIRVHGIWHQPNLEILMVRGGPS